METERGDMALRLNGTLQAALSGVHPAPGGPAALSGALGQSKPLLLNSRWALALDDLAQGPLVVQLGTFAAAWLVALSGVALLVTLHGMAFGSGEAGRRVPRAGAVLTLSSNLTSTLHAVVSALLGGMVWAFTEPQCRVALPDWVRLVVASSAGYLVSHLLCLVAMQALGLRRGDVAMYVHHAFIITWLSIGLHFNLGLWFACVLLFNEASTPFVNLFEFLRNTGRKGTRLFMVNGLLLTLSFFLCRVVFIPVVVWQFVVRCERCNAQLGFWGATGVTVGFTVLAVLNGFWFSKLLAGALGTLRKGKAKTKDA